MHEINLKSYTDFLKSKDKALHAVVKMPGWEYLSPLLELRVQYREMRKPQYRLRKNGEFRKDGTLGKNQQRMGPLTLDARSYFLDQIIEIQNRVNLKAQEINRPCIDILNDEEISLIRDMISAKVYPHGWDGTEILADKLLDKIYNDGSTMKVLFDEMITQ